MVVGGGRLGVLVDVADVGELLGVGAGAAEGVEAVAAAAVLHVLQGALERSDHSQLRIEKGGRGGVMKTHIQSGGEDRHALLRYWGG